MEGNLSYGILNTTRELNQEPTVLTKEQVIKKFLPGVVVPDDLEDPKKIGLSFVYGLIIICAVTGNTTLMTVILSNPKMRTVTNIFMVSLAVSDVLIAIGNMPFSWYIHMYNDWQLGDPLCKFSAYIKGVTIVSSILTLTAISFDRYFCVCQPLMTRYVNSPSQSVVAVTIFWLSTFALMSPLFLINRVEPKAIITGDEYNADFRVVNMCVEFLNSTHYSWAPYTYSFGVYAILYWTPLIIMSVTYGKVAHRLWVRQPVGHLDEKSARYEAHMRQKKKVMLTLVLIVVCFAICWLPFFTVHVITLFTDAIGRDTTVFLQTLGYTNCALNPLLYMLLNDTFKSHMKEMHKNCSCVRKSFRKTSTAVEMGLMSSNYNNNGSMVTNATVRGDSG